MTPKQTVTLTSGTVIIDAVTGQRRTLDAEITVTILGDRKAFGTLIFDLDGHPFEVEPDNIRS
jgi:hypothetical protein